MVLGHSRDSFCRLTGSQDLVTFWACHRAAFQHFGGVPHELLYDRTKTVVRAHVGREVTLERRIFHPEALASAHHYGFSMRLCQAYRGAPRHRCGVGARPDGAPEEPAVDLRRRRRRRGLTFDGSLSDNPSVATRLTGAQARELLASDAAGRDLHRQTDEHDLHHEGLLEAGLRKVSEWSWEERDGVLLCITRSNETGRPRLWTKPARPAQRRVGVATSAKNLPAD